MWPSFEDSCPEKESSDPFFQLDRRISMMIDVQLTSQAP